MTQITFLLCLVFLITSLEVVLMRKCAISPMM